MRRLLPLLLVAAAPGLTLAQSPAQANPLAVFQRLVGEWEGEASMAMGPGERQTVAQHELVEAVAGGTVFTIKGKGTRRAEDGTTEVVHDAFAVVFLDHDRRTPRMRAFVAAGGRWLDPELTVLENGFRWTMEDPRAGMIRYVMTFDEAGRWVETGEYSRDEGKSWVPFLEMRLRRKP